MYKYEEQKYEIFTEKNQLLFLGIRDNIQRMLKISGAFTMGNAISSLSNVEVADRRTMMACVDRLLELKEIMEIPTCGRSQDRIFVKG